MGIVYPDSTRETYTYAANGLRRQKESVAGTVRYLWDGANVLEETDETGLPQVRYLTSPNSYDVLAQQQGGVGSYDYVFDPSGNTRLLVKPEGLVVVSYAYTSFGVELDSGIPDTHYGGEYPTSPSNTFYGGEQSGIYSQTYYGGEYGSLGVGPSYNPYRFGGAVGYYMDALNRLYVRARHLDTAKGKWLSRDSLVNRDLNLYCYVGNDAVNGLDSSGLATDPAPGSDKVRIVFNAFIPTKYPKALFLSHGTYGNPIFGAYVGDNRNFNAYGGTYRVMHTIVIDPRTGKFTSWARPGMSIWKGALFGQVAPFYHQGVNGASLCTQVNKDTKRGGWNIHLAGNAKPGFSQGLPPGITYRIQIHVNPDGSVLRPYIGSIDAYPAYEIWAYVGHNQPVLIFSQMTNPTFGSVANLVPPFGARW